MRGALIMTTDTPAKPRPRYSVSGARVALIVIITVFFTVAVTLWIARTYLFPSEFHPVQLGAREERVLDEKLGRLDALAISPGRHGESGALEPEPYNEAGADRTITLSERELNALLAKNTDLARRLAIDLSDNLVSAKLLVPVDEDFPVLGGKILRVRAGLQLAYRNGRPVVVLKGISLMGVPIPNAWLGGMKNIDLVAEFGGDPGFWKSFAAGVKNISVSEGKLFIELKE
jgi:hypothetical protein